MADDRQNQLGQCFALKWCDVDYSNNQMLVRRAWGEGSLTGGKTSGSMKPVHMHSAVADKTRPGFHQEPRCLKLLEVCAI
jgi:hypothetical protein